MVKGNISSCDSAGGAGKVSVIVPVYNAIPYLEECLASVRSQTYADIEVIMVNDGSTDGSDAVCRRFAMEDARFRLVEIPNSGVSVARNTGIDMAQGDWICFMDADDTIHPSFLSHLLKGAVATGADICIGSFHCGEVSDDTALTLSDMPEVFSPEEITSKGLYQKLYVNMPWGMVFRRRIFDKGVRFRPGRRYEDLDIFYKLLLLSNSVAYFPEKLYFYRQHSGSFMNRFTPARLDVLDVTDDMLRYIRENNPSLERAARDRRFSAHFNILTLLIANGVDMPATEERCMKVIREERVAELLDRRVRLKNRLGALASFGGRRTIGFLQRFVK